MAGPPVSGRAGCEQGQAKLAATQAAEGCARTLADQDSSRVVLANSQKEDDRRRLALLHRTFSVTDGARKT